MSEAMSKKDDTVIYDKDQVVKIINSVIAKVEGAHSGGVSRDMIFEEMAALKKIIDEARTEIGQARPSEIKEAHIPTATDELDEVVKATAEATGAIMDCCDVIMEKASEVGGENGDAVTAQVMKIYESCSFQDITGQRITKVVTSLKAIEQKVDALLSIVGGKLSGGLEITGSAEDTRTGDAALLNGPQSADKAITQEDIDKMLADFD